MEMYIYSIEMYIILHICILCMHYIQGVTGGMCETSGECSLDQTIMI